MVVPLELCPKPHINYQHIHGSSWTVLSCTCAAGHIARHLLHCTLSICYTVRFMSISSQHSDQSFLCSLPAFDRAHPVIHIQRRGGGDGGSVTSERLPGTRVSTCLFTCSATGRLGIYFRDGHLILPSFILLQIIHRFGGSHNILCPGSYRWKGRGSFSQCNWIVILG